MVRPGGIQVLRHLAYHPRRKRQISGRASRPNGSRRPVRRPEKPHPNRPHSGPGASRLPAQTGAVASRLLTQHLAPFGGLPCSVNPTKPTHTMIDKTESLIADLANDLRPWVEKIESSIPTTKNHYGRYGQILAQLSKGDRNSAAVIFRAFERAGANLQGLRDGYKNFI